ncbi:hypothetical protein OBRU01_03009 [Operophtera brumata]|uniref:DUF5641 domain-containing protein n=1 Tax=Operophtera brumata TaxID=104452 RepID=A0A0L7LRN0_OPEBR|nr:hypothetical protein OBRU01_03009 [Operophtera brumata]
MKPGDLVVLLGPDALQNLWTKGIIKRVFPGANERIRTEEVPIKNGVLLTRTVARLAVIPVAADSESEC